MSKRADEEKLARLHNQLADEFIKACKTETMPDGTVLRPAPSTLNAARQFLKDNGIEADVSSRDMSDLDKALEGIPDDEWDEGYAH